MARSLTRDTFVELAEAYIEFRNTSNLDRLERVAASIFDTETDFSTLRALDEMVTTAFPDWQMDLTDVWFDETAQVGIMHHDMSGTFEGEWRPGFGGERLRFAPTGESFSFSGVTIFRFEDGEFADYHAYKDQITFFTENGILPGMREFAVGTIE